MKTPILILTVLWLNLSGFASSSVMASLDGLCAELDASLSSPTLAVLPFESRVVAEPNAGLSIAEYLVACLSTNPKLQIVERMKLAQVLQEQDLANSDMVDSSSAPKLGLLLSARTLLVGSVSDMMGRRMVMASLIDAESGKVIHSARVSLEAEPLQAFSQDLLGESSQVSAVLFRSAIVPGWGAFFAGKPVRGSIWLGLWAAGIGASVWGFVSANGLYDEYQATADLKKRTAANARVQEIIEDCGDACLDTEGNLDQPLLNQKIDDLAEKDYQSYQDRQDLAVAFAIGTGVIWAANLVDAFIVGRDHKRKVDLYFAPMADGKGAVAGARTSF